MTATHFQRQALPPAKTFYERELGKLSRPARGWAKGRCPFHESKSGTSFSVNLISGGFHCFGCGARGGDVLAFVMRRDNLNFKAAAQSLGAWDEAPSAEVVYKLTEQECARRRQRQLEETEQHARHDRVIRLRDQLHAAVAQYQETESRLSELRRGMSPDWDGEEEGCWSSLTKTLTDIRDLERAYGAAAGLEAPNECKPAY